MLIKISYDINGEKKTQVLDDKIVSGDYIGKMPNFSIVSGGDFNFDEKTKTVELSNSIVYVPNYKVDLIQGALSRGHYFEFNNLKIMSKYLKEDSVVLDCGANIGNHTLYFANECKVKKIYAFEPVPSTYKILEKNIKLNKLEKIVKLKNVGLSDRESMAAIESYNIVNIGGTRLCEQEEGDIKLITIDSLRIKEKIDFIKIDVEGMDYHLLKGAEKTISKNMPVISIESFKSEFEKSDPFLRKLGYKLTKKLSDCEFIYTPVKNKKS